MNISLIPKFLYMLIKEAEDELELPFYDLIPYNPSYSQYNIGILGKVKWKPVSRVQLFVTPWTVAFQGPLSMEFPRQEHWTG